MKLLSKFSISSTRFRIILLFLVILVPVVGFMFRHLFVNRQLAVQEAHQDALRIAKLAAAQQEQLLEGARQLLTMLSEVPEITGDDEARCNAFALKVLEQFSTYSNVGVISVPSGDAICSALPPAVMVNAADRFYYQEAVRTRGFSVGEYQVGRITGVPTINLGYPIMSPDGKTVVGVVFAALDLNQVAGYMRNGVELPKGGIISMLDRTGVFLVRIPDAGNLAGSRLNNQQLLQTILARSEGTYEGVSGVDQKFYYHGFSPVLGTVSPASYLMVAIPRTTALFRANSDFMNALAVLSTVVLAVLAVALLGAQFSIVRPINKLLAAIRRVNQADLHSRIGPPYPSGEIGSLARAFDDMTGRLREAFEQRQSAQEKLASNERYFRSIVEHSDDGFVTLTKEGIVTYVSPSTVSILGYPVGHFMGKNGYKAISEFVNPEDVGFVGNQFAKLISQAGVVIKMEFRARHKDGAYRWIEATGKNETDDPAIGALVVNLHDVTKRKDAEQEILESESRYRRLFELNPDAIVIHDGKRILFLNPAALRMIGAQSTDQVIGRLLSDVLDPNDLETIRKRVETVFRTGKPAPPFESRVKRLDGSWVEIEFISAPLVYKGKQAIQVISRDIGDRKKLERAKSEFISTASHQLRTPLSALYWLVDSLREPLKKERVSAEIRAYFDDISQSVTRLVRLVEDLLSVSRLEAGTAAMQPREMDITRYARQVIKIMGPYIRSRRHTVVLRSSPRKLPPVYIDEQMLYNIFQDLISNAADYSPPKTPITVRIEAQNSHVMVSVVNKGPAITKEDQSRLFQKFFRSEDARKKKTAGTGLGLFIVKSLVEQAGGTVGFRSEEGEDTVFYFTLPVVQKKTGTKKA